MNIVEVCGVNIEEEDLILVNRFCNYGANKLMPVIITLSSQDMRGKLLQEPWCLED